MVSLGNWLNQSVTISLKTNCATLSLSAGKNSKVYSFDLTGRWWTGIVDGISYRRGLDGKVVAKWISAGQTHERRWLSEDEGQLLEESVRDEFSRFVLSVNDGITVLSPSLSSFELKILNKIGSYTIEDSKLNAGNFGQVYKPVGILPPDQYMSVILQVTEGCSFNTCTFCNFYRDHPFHIKNLPEFEEHIRAVKFLLGDGLSLRRTIFLGDANALVTPTLQLIPMLERIHQHFDLERLGGIYAFLDGFSGEKKSVEEYRQIQQLGVRRIYIGLESGNEELLKFIKKPGKPADALQAVNAIKAAGISVGIILLLGAGGVNYSNDHIRDSIALVNRMNLDLDDLIYFSELVENEGMEYTQTAYANGVTPLSTVEKIQQAELIENGFQFFPGTGSPHISRYDIREFVY